MSDIEGACPSSYLFKDFQIQILHVKRSFERIKTTRVYCGIGYIKEFRNIKCGYGHMCVPDLM